MNLPEPFKHSTFAAAQAAAAATEAAAAAIAGSTAAAAGAPGDVVAATPAPTRVGGSSSRCAVPEGMVVAPWSVTALAVLLHR